MIRTILFDLDGTLVDSYVPIRDSLNVVRAHFGLPAKTEAEVRREVGRGLESLIAENVGPERTEEGVRLFRQRYREIFLGQTRLLPGVPSTLSELAARKYGMAVASNKPAYFTRGILESLGIAGNFGAVLGPEMVGRPKPDPEMLQRALAELDGRPSEAAYVGDMALDVETARRAGVLVIVLPSGSSSREELGAAGPDLMVEKFEDLLEVFPPLR